ncbi:hypothetical protein V7S57_02555 [Caulobacter sp. CCNWLY153]|uniref:hypothetical protein n=1 Tax=unclassified Caulobacter TaxID=2648921 RepID=UPI002FF23AFE
MPTPTKLTPLQRQALALVAAGAVFENNTGYGSWRIMGASPTVVGRLGSMGLVTKARVDDRSYRFELTETGQKTHDEAT